MQHDSRGYLQLKAAHYLFQKPLVSLLDDERKQVEQQAKQAFILQQKILASAEAKTIKVSQHLVDEAKSVIKKNYPDTQTFKKEIAQYQLDEALLNHALRAQIKVDQVMQQIALTASEVSHSDVVAFYHSNREKFHQAERREAAHILVTINEQFAENCEKEAYSRLKDIEHQLNKDLSLFAEMSRRHSECPTALDGGKLGVIPQGTLYPELDKVLFQMEEQSLSPIVQSEVGLHLLHCMKIHAAKVVPLEEAAQSIQAYLQAKNEKMVQRQWIKQLMNTEHTA